MSNIEKSLGLILDGNYNLEEILDIIPKENIVFYQKNDMIINQKDKVDYLYFLLSGQASVWNEIEWTNNVIEYLKPLEILGLIECLNNISYYTAYVIAESTCIVLKISSRFFLNLIKNNNILCFNTLLVFGNIAASNMENSAKKSLFSADDILGHYLFAQSHRELPYICSLTRVELAERLHMNLRTLHRHIASLKDKNYLIIQKGKIIIEEEQYKRLAIRYSDLIL